MEEKEAQELTLKDILQIIQEYKAYIFPKWKRIVIVGIIGATLGLCISIIKKPKYVGSLTFVIDEENKMGGLAGLISSFGLGGSQGQSLSSPENVLQFLSARSLVEKTLLRPVNEDGYRDRTYADLYIKTYEMDKHWEDDDLLRGIRYKVGESRSEFSRQKDSILHNIYERLIEKKQVEIKQLNAKNSFIGVNVITRSEVFSKNFSIELVDVVSEYYITTKTQKTKLTVDVLQRQVDSINYLLHESMGEAASSLDMIYGLNPAMLTQKVSSSKQQVQVQISLAALQEMIKNLELAKIKLLDNTASFNLVDTPVYPLEVKEITIPVGILGGGILAFFMAVVFWILRKQYTEALGAE